MTFNLSLSVFFGRYGPLYIRYQHIISLKSYDLKIESFCFVLVAVSTQKHINIRKNTFWFVFIISYYWY